MKNKLPILIVTTAFAALTSVASADIMEQGHYRVANHGRAGFVVRPVTQVEAMPKSQSHATTVALVMEKPQEPGTRVLTAGRSGFTYMPTR